MAFTLEIKSKTIVRSKKIDFKSILQNCGLSYGQDGEFFVLKEGMEGDVAILYNPQRIGRGITCDMSNVKKGKIVLHYNIPTTATEIGDFINVVKEIENQWKKIDMYCVEEECTYTTKSLEENKDEMVRFSLEKLKEFCSDEEYSSYLFTLAMWPLELTKEMTEKFKACSDLREFEQILHDKQNLDVYYAKPRLFQKESGEIGAFYTFTEECESIFPVRANGFLNFDNIEVEEGFVRFYICSEQTVMDGLFNYEKFIQYFLDRGAEYYDNSHILLPSMTKEQLKELAKELEE
jgi:hypothetical protein